MFEPPLWWFNTVGMVEVPRPCAHPMVHTILERAGELWVKDSRRMRCLCRHALPFHVCAFTSLLFASNTARAKYMDVSLRRSALFLVGGIFHIF